MVSMLNLHIREHIIKKELEKGWDIMPFYLKDSIKYIKRSPKKPGLLIRKRPLKKRLLHYSYSKGIREGRKEGLLPFLIILRPLADLTPKGPTKKGRFIILH